MLRFQGPPEEEATRRRIIESIIEAEKPAHTAYTLDIEIIPADEGSQR
jgi:hypothetical protein